ncbi:hypothetical protein LUZ63_011044 [Rhynchospora breviuscula]|uniref:BHLH domain-containing protein n=1 Tax=Rhynchospora breviuscula TaxID=2022672 RepID=A0A9Q0HQ26_9POAL|nr:hypothetical protein LUZ63_011044 [Rhynchospora breviuscula]
MDSIGLPCFELDTGSPLMLSMPDLEPLELIWRKGPVEEPLRGPLASTSPSQTEVQWLAPTEEEVLMGVDEMASWLHYQFDTNDTGPDLNGQPASGSNNAHNHVVLGKDARSACHVGSLETRNCAPNTCKQKPGASGGGEKNKRKAKTVFEGPSEVSTVGANEKRKDALPESMASRKSRTTEVHNLSERRRRSRINERMKALQELIPRSNKLDKASILDQTIAYVKSLQRQVKMMSMRRTMRPPMFPSGLPFLPSMAVGMGMNTGTSACMNMAMGLVPGMTPFGQAIPYPPINQPIQAPMLQIPHQHDIAAGMFPYSRAGYPYHFCSVVPGQAEASPQVAMKTLAISIYRIV